MGGYMAAPASLIHVLRSMASGFVFTTALPPPLAAASCANLHTIQTRPILRQQHQERVQFTKKALLKATLPVLPTSTHSLPFHLGEARRCQEMGRRLLEEWGVDLQTHNYPTVPKGHERFRLTPSRLHTPEMVEKRVEGLLAVWSQQARGSRSLHMVGPVGLEPTTAPL